ncbi:hypothetical protein OGATHE_003535 [Ogataea polymorpha]|uniref:Uncharacterized protein n=1 Tax=Ogataea polymorpha TaxID=460523 RepID=A0A9P8P466_9ASCO|nr:hypothetical protein OGATHE_003535 [Ogataea polymorpha]
MAFWSTPGCPMLGIPPMLGMPMLGIPAGIPLGIPMLIGMLPGFDIIGYPAGGEFWKPAGGLAPTIGMPSDLGPF